MLNYLVDPTFLAQRVSVQNRSLQFLDEPPRCLIRTTSQEYLVVYSCLEPTLSVPITAYHDSHKNGGVRKDI